MSNYTIRALRTLDDLHEAADLQRIYWGDDSESVVPAQMMFTIAHYGGHVLAAYDGSKMIGVLIGLLGTNETEDSNRPAMANLLIASKRMVVLPEYRGGGVGYDLKLAQRQAALRQGIRLVTWTFDPLLSLNAHLNLRKLGCVSQSYYVDLYGTSERGGLATLGWSDRLRADWWVTHRRVDERLHGERRGLTLTHYLEGNATLVNPTAPPQGAYVAAPEAGECRSTFGLVEIPLNVPEMRRAAPELARGWQEHIREVFTYMFRRGYTVTDFLRTQHEGRDRGFYVLSFDLPFDHSLN